MELFGRESTKTIYMKLQTFLNVHAQICAC